ncbi:hypothetical protein DICPUDRAFT_149912 [Dictyostelium purpureum]|uniref:Uncharacterized protein n=1 Tax=Dictyostelium purpureum TaxID=5786 RepID=F0ZEZ4_DICPU|nr:uncharacterized protein DICPUDRAFT_149912 [Dictyostelium purpureum]EGC37517.1 hypothetical protein DICPUDRAFT_149912 [Dictyostelium purpureum]|eukprot:XP_003285991.1 hypothetical protein DICPUDRAFT_149912 [Dictyostelium purpureum]
MKLILLLLSIIFVSVAKASITVKYGTCLGVCYCPAKYIENGKYKDLDEVTIPDYPNYLNLNMYLNVTYKPSKKVIEFVKIHDKTPYHTELAYPIDEDDNSYNVTQCAYILSSRFHSTREETCYYEFMCNADGSSSSSKLQFLTDTSIQMIGMYTLMASSHLLYITDLVLNGDWKHII